MSTPAQEDDFTFDVQRKSAYVFTDPSLADGSRVLYDREISVEVRQSEDIEPETGSIQPIKFKILVLGEENMLQSVRIECSSEVDLFFHYYHTLDGNGILTQKLMVSFLDYPKMLIKMCNNCIQEPHSNMAIMYLNATGTARIDFVQNMEYKFVELLSLSFLRSPDEFIRQEITFRYNTLKYRSSVLTSRLQEVNEIVKLKNPSLFLQIQKTPSKSAPFQSSGVASGVVVTPAFKRPGTGISVVPRK